MMTSPPTSATSAANIDRTRQRCMRTADGSVVREEATGEAMISHFRLSGSRRAGLVTIPGIVTPVINVSHVAHGFTACDQRVGFQLGHSATEHSAFERAPFESR